MCVYILCFQKINDELEPLNGLPSLRRLTLVNFDLPGGGKCKKQQLKLPQVTSLTLVPGSGKVFLENFLVDSLLPVAAAANVAVQRQKHQHQQRKQFEEEDEEEEEEEYDEERESSDGDSAADEEGDEGAENDDETYYEEDEEFDEEFEEEEEFEEDEEEFEEDEEEFEEDEEFDEEFESDEEDDENRHNSRNAQAKKVQKVVDVKELARTLRTQFPALTTLTMMGVVCRPQHVTGRLGEALVAPLCKEVNGSRGGDDKDPKHRQEEQQLPIPPYPADFKLQLQLADSIAASSQERWRYGQQSNHPNNGFRSLPLVRTPAELMVNCKCDSKDGEYCPLDENYDDYYDDYDEEGDFEEEEEEEGDEVAQV